MRLLQKLGIVGESESCLLTTANGSKLYHGQKVSLSIRGCGLSEEIDIPNILALPNLPDVSDSIVAPSTLAAHSHLRDVSIPTIESDDIDILLGADVLFKYPVLETVVREGNVPSAKRTILGWALSGSDETMTELAHRVNFTYTQVKPEIERPCANLPHGLSTT